MSNSDHRTSGLLPGSYNVTAAFLCSEEVLRVELTVLTLQQHAVERK